MNRFAVLAFAVACLLIGGLLIGCTREDALPRYGFAVRNVYPHDPQAFTEGLWFRDGYPLLTRPSGPPR